jgi:hypothetical protein
MTAIMLWLKFLAFLRSHDETAYLIRTLIESVKDMSVFFLILFIAWIGFSDAFLSTSNAMVADF